MKGIKQAALAAALTIAAVGSASAVYAQNREPLVRALDATRGSRMGVSVRDVEDTGTDTRLPKSGVVVDTVQPGGPADKAGVKVGDLMTEFDGERVRSVRQFSRLVQETPPGRAVAVALSRGGQRSTVTVTVERASVGDDFSMRLLDLARPPLPPEPPAPARAPRAPASPVPMPAMPFEAFRVINGRHLGVSIQTLDEQLAQYFGVKEGVLVTSVSSGSAGETAGLKAGDVITTVNGRHVYEASDVTRALDRTENSNEFTIEVQRDKKAVTVKGTLEPRTRSGSRMY